MWLWLISISCSLTIQNFPGPRLLLKQHIVTQCYTEIYLMLCRETEKLHTAGIVAKCWQNCIRNKEKNNKCDDLSVSIWLPICKKVHSIQMMNPCLIFWNISSWAQFPCNTDLSDFFPPLCLFSPHRLTSHLWISHGLTDNSWSPCHGPAAFNMNYKMASQAYQWMTDWMCMARGQRGVRAQ